MSVSYTLPRQVSKDGGFGDPEVTPKPLRIAKRGCLRSSRQLTFSSLHYSSPVHPQHNHVPTRRSSASISLTQLLPSQQDPNSPITECNSSETSIDLHKQGQSRSSHTGRRARSAEYQPSAPSASVPTYARPHSQCTPTLFKSGLGGTQAETSVITAVRSRARRAFSTGIFEKINWLSPVNGLPSTLSTPLVSHTGRRRVVTTNDARHRISDCGKTDRAHVSRQQRFFKERLMPRMVSKSAPGAHNSQLGGKERRQSVQLQPQNVQSPESQPCQDLNIAKRSISDETEILSDSEWDNALSAFPTPPRSYYTAPTSAASTRSSRPPSQRYRNLRKPEHAAVMGAQLTLTSEYDELEFEDERTMLVAIDIQGVLNSTISGQNLWSQHTGLDVVVIIDNSNYTSSGTLMGSCETARFLASTLNVITDRMAIICISSHPDSDSTLIWPLSRIKPHKIKTSLDTITTTRQVPTAALWKQAIIFARKILMQSPIPNEDTEPLQDTFGHIFLLTGNAAGLPPEPLTDDKIQFHVICPANVPIEHHNLIRCNGWKLQSLSGNELHAVSANKITDPSTMLNKLRGLIMHARGGKLAGVLSDIFIDLRPGHDCSIEEVMGSTKFSTLNPGESSTVLVKLRIYGARARGRSLTQSGTSLDTNDIMNELDEMLQSSAVQILTARLKYRHSDLPKGTICSINAKCCLKQQTRSIEPGRSQTQFPAVQPKDCTTLVQKRLAHYTATHGSPRHALSNLRREFGETGSHSYCPSYIKLIMEELEFQVRIVVRLELAASPKKPTRRPNSLALESSTGHSETGSFLPENQKPRDWITDAVDEGVSKPEDPQSSVLFDPGKKTGSVRKATADANEAKAIRVDVRRPSENSKPRRKEVTIRGGSARKVRVRDLVLGNMIIDSDIARSTSSTWKTIGKEGVSSPR